MDLDFPGVVGLAAGFDRHGVLRERAHLLGLGAIETGTVHRGTAAPPAWFSADPVAPRAMCGVSIGKHPATPWSEAEEEMLSVLRRVHLRADYLTLSPGRQLPPPALFARLLGAAVAVRDRLAASRGRHLPIVAKLPSAWLTDRHRGATAAGFIAAGADGLLVSAEGAASPEAARATLAEVATAVGRECCLISVGGIESAAEALARLRAGAQLVQVHRGVARGGLRFLTELERILYADSPRTD